MNMPAIYEFSVEPPGEKVKYPVYLTVSSFLMFCFEWSFALYL